VIGPGCLVWLCRSSRAEWPVRLDGDGDSSERASQICNGEASPRQGDVNESSESPSDQILISLGRAGVDVFRAVSSGLGNDDACRPMRPMGIEIIAETNKGRADIWSLTARLERWFAGPRSEKRSAAYGPARCVIARGRCLPLSSNGQQSSGPSHEILGARTTLERGARTRRWRAATAPSPAGGSHAARSLAGAGWGAVSLPLGVDGCGLNVQRP